MNHTSIVSLRLKALLLALVLTTTIATTAQQTQNVKKERTSELYGGVYDSFTKARLKAFVTLMTEDSTVVDTATTQIWRTRSAFTLKVPRRKANYIIKGESEGYETGYMNYSVAGGRRTLYYELPQLLLKKKADDIYKEVSLDGVVVKGTMVQIAYRGDTIVYNASAFNMPEGSMLDALVAQMPGAEIKDNGDIYVNGRKVDYLMLNGKDFFKGQNKVMLDNLPYYTVKELKVYDRSSEKSRMVGRDVEQKDFVMDVSLKREYSRGYLANAEAGAGSDNRWMARLFGLYYDDHTRVTLFGNANNVNENRKPGSDGDWSPTKVERGLLTTRQAGVGITTENKNKTLEGWLNVTTKWEDSDNQRVNLAETFANDNNIMNHRRLSSQEKAFSMNVNNMIQWQWKKFRLLSLNSLSYDNNRSTSLSTDSTFQDRLINNSLAAGKGHRRNLSFDGSVQLIRLLEANDYFLVRAYGDYARSKPADNFSLNRTAYENSATTDLRNIYADSRTHAYSFTLGTAYSYSMANGWELSPELEYKQLYRDERDYNYRLERLENPVYYEQLGLLPSTQDSLLNAFDAENSYSAQTMTRRYRASLAIYRNMKKGFIHIELPVAHFRERMNYSQAALDTIARRHFTTFEPHVILRYGQHSLDYFTRVKPANFTSLMPMTNTADPLSVRINNTGLKNTVTHEVALVMRFNGKKKETGQWLKLNASMSNNAQGTRTSYNTETGVYTYMNDNVDGNWDAHLRGGLNGIIGRIKNLRYNAEAGVKYQHSVDFAVAYDDSNTELSKVNTTTSYGQLKLTYTLGKLTIGTVGRITFRNSRSNRNDFTNIDVCDYQYGGRIVYTIPLLELNIASDINMYSRRGYQSSMMNTNDLVWNAQMSRAFLKGRLVAKIQAYDILHRIASKQYSINAQGRTETWYNSIPRYFMATLAYRIDVKPKK